MKKLKKLFKKSKGFTLIEMLVVVLIIGILAGIALPQYQSAVRKTRVAEAKITLRALVDATDRYFLQNGYGDWSYDDLDIEMPTEYKNWDIAEDECADGGCLFYARPKWETGYQIKYASQRYFNGEDIECGNFICFGYNETGNKICKQIGGKETEFDSTYQL